MDDLIGQVFGNYRLIRLLGRGGFAHVYLGEHIHLQTQVAIKVLSTQLVPKDLERFRREAKTVASLDHPHIVHVFDFGIEKDRPFLVMNYASQGTVQQRHAQENRLPLSTILAYVQQIAPALQYAHDRKIIHRDVKPENMLIGNEGEILLSDFGIAATSATSTSQQTKTTAGTAMYMAPEQIMGKPCVASDQYALGIIVYTWLCGEPPFQGSFFEICAQHMHAPVPSPQAKNPEIPVEIEQCVLKALAKDPEQRFTCVQDFAMALVASARPTLSDSPSPLGQEQIPDSDATSIKPAASSDARPEDSTSIKTPLMVLSDAEQDASTYVKTLPAAHSDARQGNIASVTPAATVLPLSSSIDTEPVVLSPVAPPSPRTVVGQKRKRSLLVALLCVLVVALVGSGLGYAVVYKGEGTPGATVTITPASMDLKNTYTITGVTGTPDGAQHQAAARQIAATTPAQTQTVNATGTKTTPGTHATGRVAIGNSDEAHSLTLAAGTAIPNNSCTCTPEQSKLVIILDEAVALPPAPPGQASGVVVPAHVSQVGAIGNLSMLLFSFYSPQTCLNSGDQKYYPCWSADNTSGGSDFTGGTDPQTYSIVAQSDIDNAANSLEQANQPDATHVLQGQIHAYERFVSTPSCKPNVQADHNAGDNATSVTVTVSYTCTGEVYDQDGALATATQWLKDDATKSPGAGYALVGQVKTSLIQASIANASQGSVTISVTAEGIWVYQFGASQKAQLAQLLAGKKESDAQALLLGQQGVKQADIQLSGNNTQLPADPRQVTLVIEPIPGL